MHFAARQTSHPPPEITLPQFVLPAVLPDDVPALKALLLAHVAHATVLEAAVAAAVSSAVAAAVAATTQALKREAQETVQRLIEQMVLARHRLFGVSSEQLPAQGRLFDEAEALAQTTTDAQDMAPMPSEPLSSASGSESDNAVPPQKATRGKRGPLPAELTRVEVIHDVPQDERTCPCGTAMVEIGEEVSEQLDIVPMQIRVLRPIRKRYGCPASLHAPVSAALPAQPLPKSNARADFLAMLLTVRLLEGYRGYLMTDGYDDYNAIARTAGVEHLACWAHVRRRFVEAARVQPKGKRGHADEAVALIGKLYGVEREQKAADDATRYRARQAQSVPALAYLQKYWDRRAMALP